MAGDSVGQIHLDLLLKDRSFQTQIDKSVNTALNRVDRSVGNGLTSTFSKFGKLVAGTFAVTQIAKFGAECLSLGSNLAEVQNVVDTTFTSMNGKVNQFAKSAITSFGLSETVAKKYMGTFGAMSKAFGFSEKQAYDMSAALTGLSGDVASFYNMSGDEAYTKLKSVFTGETESLKELGVVMTQNALDQYALANGYGKTTAKMSEQEKVALRFAFVQKQLSLASGDFIRTQDGWANQTRVLALQFDSLKASIGQGLIAVLTPVVKWLNLILAKLIVVAEAFSDFMTNLFGTKSESKGGLGGLEQGLDNANAGIGDLSQGASDANSGMEDISNSADNAGDSAEKAAQKMKKSLMGFDALNTLGDNSSSDGSSTGGDSSGGGTAGGGIALPPVEMPTIPNEDKTEIPKWLQVLKKTWSDLVKGFEKGFKIGLKDANFDVIKNNLSSIGKSVKDIFTNPQVVGAAKRWVDSAAISLGKITGSAARVAITVGETLSGGVSDYLNNNKNNISGWMVRMLDIGSETQTLIGNFSVAFADIFEGVFGTDTAKSVVENITGIFSGAFMNITEVAAKTGRDIADMLLTPIIENKDKLILFGDGLMKNLDQATGSIRKFMDDTFSTIQSVYDQHVAPAFANFRDGFSLIFGSFLDTWNTYVQPTIQKVGEWFADTFNNHVQPALSSAIEFFGKWGENVSIFYKEVMAPFISWLQANILPVLMPILGILGSALSTVFNIFADIIKGIFDVLGGLMDFLKGVFTGDWELAWQGICEIVSGIWGAISSLFTNAFEHIARAAETIWNSIKSTAENVWNGIKNFFSGICSAIGSVFSGGWNGIKNNVLNVVNGIKNGIFQAFTWVKNSVKGILDGITGFFSDCFNGLINIIKAPVNAIIGVINGLIDGLNAINVEIPDWIPGIGGSRFGFNLGHIPYLANGGYVAANTPQLAIIGDNKREGEIVAPESKIAEAVAAGLAMVMSKLQSKQPDYALAGDITIPIYLDGGILDTVIVSAQNRRNLRSGGRS